MSDLLSSALLREMRQDDPRRWLDWSLDALIEKLGGMGDHPRARELLGECRIMREAIDSDGDVDGREVTRMVNRVDAIQRLVESELDGTTYKLTRDRDAGRRRRSTRPNTERDSESGRKNRKRKRRESTRPPAPETSQPPRRGTRSQHNSVRAPEDRVHPADTSYKHISPTKLSPVPADSEPPKRSWVTPRQVARESPVPERPQHDTFDSPPPEAPQRALVLHQPGPPQVAEPSVIERSDSRPPLKVTSLGPITVELLDIDYEHLDPGLVLLHEPRGAAAEAYRALFYRIGATSEARRIMVTTSSKEDDGSICAANLALAIAEGSDERVLLVEARFAQPRIADLFSYIPSECFGRRLARHRRESDAPWRVAQLADSNLSLLSVNPSQATPPALDAQALADVVASFVDSGFGYVIIDGPPATDGSDARYVARGAEGIVMVVYANQSRQRMIRRAVHMLGGAPIVGYVLCER